MWCVVHTQFSTNALADQAAEYFETDFDIETEYHSMLDGKYQAFFRLWFEGLLHDMH